MSNANVVDKMLDGGGEATFEVRCPEGGKEANQERHVSEKKENKMH